MKRLAALLLALVLVLSACGGSGGKTTDKGKDSETSGKTETGEGKETGKETGGKETGKEIPEKELKIASADELETMDYVISSKNPDMVFNANFVDGLLENDNTGKLSPSIAEKWEPNEDKTVWTFTLREGVKWVTSTGEEWPETVVAEDFVTGLRHGAEFDSETSWLLEGVIKGYADYLKSKKTDEDWTKVGVKAVDEKTLEFTMESPVPYFDSMATYTVLYPINRQFLESKGEGCKLGAPNKDNCEFGTKDPASILYNGGFVLTQLDAKSQTVITKNPSYWDAKNIHLSKVTYIYDDGSDPYSGMKGFEQGNYPQAALNPSWKDYDKYFEKYKDNAYNTLPNASTFGVNFNFNRQSFEKTKYAKDENLRKATREAVLNQNFRKALKAAMDIEKYLGVSTTEEVAKATVRNINNFPEAGTSKNGTYFELVQKAHTELTGKEVNLEDGQYPWLNKEEALKYIEAAKKEGIKFPIHIDFPVVKTSKRLVDQASSLQASVKENTDGQIILEPNLLDVDTVQNIAFQLEDPKAADYDMSTFAGWGPDFADPKSFADTYSAKNGTYLKNMGLNTEDKDKEIKDKIGLTEYTKLIEEAAKITDDMDARYEAYAKADALLIDKAFFLPTSQQARGQVVSKYVPFTKAYSSYGASDEKWKGLELSDEIIKASDREAAYKEWQKARSEAAK